MKTRYILLIGGLLAAMQCLKAEVPAGYYNAAENKNGQQLLTALAGIVGPHTTVSYDGLLTLYKTSDVYPDGTIWDMYSTKHWNPSSTCGNYSNVGDCYNREHSFPKSWFNNSSPMNSDAFHVYPTDGKVNGQRSNYPYGECAGGSYLASHNGVQALGRLGTCTSPGYTGKVFEPDDQYKGDFARSYFYMITAYNSRVSSWKSDMLAGNSFPAFKTWALDVLLKWHRQDPVSEKEIARNEVVYDRQRNRNPYIDHPELVEFIWGNKSSLQWTSSGTTVAEFVLPATGSTVDFGVTASGHALTRTITVRTVNATAPITVTTMGTGFSTSVSSVAPTATNSASGKELTLKYLPSAIGNHAGTLILTMGDEQRTVNLKGECVAGLPVSPTSYVTDRSFQVNWTYVGDDQNGMYTLSVNDDAGSLEGYPRQVNASAGNYTVTDLESSTTYTYQLQSRTLQSSVITVTTGEPVPAIDFLFDGELEFSAAPGEPSATAELLMETDNIEGNVTVTVTAPFQLSTDHSNWAESLTVSPDEGRFYLRMYSETAGTFTGTLTATAGTYTSEEIDIHGTCSSMPTFHEDFEADAKGFGSYGPHSAPYQGTAAAWEFDNVGLYSSDPGHDSNQSVRFGKTATSSITMTSDRSRGIGTVSFWAKYWGSESNPEIEVQFSTDGGETFQDAGTATVSSATWQQYSVHVGCGRPARIRLQQKSGSRLNLDDVEMTDYTSGVSDPGAERHLWDAYALNGELTVTVEDGEAVELSIYSIDGREIFTGTLRSGVHTYTLTPGLYLVSSADHTRRVIL